VDKAETEKPKVEKIDSDSEKDSEKNSEDKSETPKKEVPND
jgi:hypothetical protein